MKYFNEVGKIESGDWAPATDPIKTFSAYINAMLRYDWLFRGVPGCSISGDCHQAIRTIEF